jgi:hypothetical protein
MWFFDLQSFGAKNDETGRYVETGKRRTSHDTSCVTYIDYDERTSSSTVEELHDGISKVRYQSDIKTSHL